MVLIGVNICADVMRKENLNLWMFRGDNMSQRVLTTDYVKEETVNMSRTRQHLQIDGIT